MKILTLFLFLFLFPFTNQAQTPFLTIEKQVQMLTLQMANDLNLDTPAYNKLENLNREKIVRAYELHEMYSSTEDLKRKKLNELEININSRLKKILRPDQLALYEAKRKGKAAYFVPVDFN